MGRGDDWRTYKQRVRRLLWINFDKFCTQDAEEIVLFDNKPPAHSKDKRVDIQDTGILQTAGLHNRPSKLILNLAAQSFIVKIIMVLFSWRAILVCCGLALSVAIQRGKSPKRGKPIKKSIDFEATENSANIFKRYASERRKDEALEGFYFDDTPNDIYSYDDDSYYGDKETFESLLPQCYYPTPTTYLGLEYCYGHQTRTSPPPCVANADLVYDNQTGAFSADQTFYNCMANIPDVASMPTFYNGKYHGCLMVLTQMTLLNLVRVDEVDGVAELQVIIDFTWTDRRYNMPLFWEEVPFSYSGFDITTILTNQSTVLWRPEIVFPDAQGVEVMAETLTLLPYNDVNGTYTTFLYEVTYDLLLVQPGFNFRRYPNDAQNLIVRFTAMNYDAKQLQLFPSDIACSYLPDRSCSFSNNAIWIWKDEASFQSCTAYADQKASLIYPAYVYYSVKIVRQGNGIIVRLVLPLTLLLLISALTFWVTYENRVDTTITLLLSVSALYIIILQSIPLVGYLTDIDKFVFWMFLLLCVVVALHQMYATLYEKTETWPLRVVYLRLIEMFGRCFTPPAIIFYFLGTIEFGSQSVRNAMIVVVVTSMSILLVREVYGVRSAYYHAIEKLTDKFNRPGLTTKQVSKVEIVTMNHYFFNKWSTELDDIANALNTKGDLHFEKPTSIMLKNMSSLARVMVGSDLYGLHGEKDEKSTTLLRRRWGSSDHNDSHNGDADASGEVTVEMADLGHSPVTADSFHVSFSAPTNPLHASHPLASPSLSSTSPAASGSARQSMHIDSDDEGEA